MLGAPSVVPIYNPVTSITKPLELHLCSASKIRSVLWSYVFHDIESIRFHLKSFVVLWIVRPFFIFILSPLSNVIKTMFVPASSVFANFNFQTFYLTYTFLLIIFYRRSHIITIKFKRTFFWWTQYSNLKSPKQDYYRQWSQSAMDCSRRSLGQISIILILLMTDNYV